MRSFVQAKKRSSSLREAQIFKVVNNLPTLLKTSKKKTISVISTDF